MNKNTSKHREAGKDQNREHSRSPFAPNSRMDVEAMLEAIEANSIEELFDIPSSVRYEEALDIESRSEQDVVNKLRGSLSKNEDLTEFLGRGHYSHYVPSIVDHLSLRSEFLTSYTQYQPEVTQGFLQSLFEYQSLLVELTGLEIANCSMYDASTALGEAACLADRVRTADGSHVLVPDYLRDEQRSVLENYVAGSDLVVEEFSTKSGMVDPDTLEDTITKETVLLYAESPTSEGVIEEHLTEVERIADEHDALFCLGTDLVALALLQSPATVGADIVVGDASVLGLPTAYGMGLGIFACREEFLRQVPGRLVGASVDDTGSRAYTLTLQTREQHIKRERATSNICTNQAWVALRTAIHATSLGPSGLVSLAEECHRLAEALAAELNDIDGVSAPIRDCHHFRDFRARIESDANELAAQLAEDGFAIHVLNGNEIQISVNDTNKHRMDDLADAVAKIVN
ncbi:aminomethyl-transferring glycine dehydrogenase subunit GcvPA [Halobium palmae]|uniref:Aminomethyl-transferring glycine dehydrogenase subunit GcvPA n=1 Tax=Halobium palmae TaxID=1776492 RepID=A0ABD5RUH4_9EURY